MAGVPPGSLEKLLHQSDENDFTITCKNKAFKVEKAVISAGSWFFWAGCNLSFREKMENRLDLPEEHEDVVARVLLFLYTGDYEDLQIPRFSTELLPAAASSTTSSSNDPLIAPSPRGLVAPLTPEDDNTPEDHWMKNCPGFTLSQMQRFGSEEREEMRARVESMKPAANPAKQRKLVQALEKNTQVYICADKLQMVKLKECAADKFKKRLWAIADAKDAYPAVRLALEGTREEDTVLCNEALRYCIRHHERIEVFPKFLAFLHDTVSSAWTIGVELQRKNDDLQQSLGQKLKLLGKEKHRAEVLKAQADDELDSVVQLVNGTKFMSGKRCTNAEMKLELHTNSLGTKQYQLTCECCNKQQLGVYITVARFGDS
ncbi:hypothetical protein EPUS_06036 [Endocarpon pusillum Z07020]|uniref:BTB domain-containing protein n=1 Tax=Endocarpon pusillum (strain Z07020 / HMAS-L-300199) TaxID=1263415 RepID=U1G502_ENDPU|nr:uncharacterized protein EPUS_06036 [Endocarpon pusillum Z07020]ERF72407.1 hypothetical protein EPUS_06036 [Endocarpon pusillum Z07020]